MYFNIMNCIELMNYIKYNQLMLKILIITNINIYT